MSVPSFPVDLGDGYRLTLDTWSSDGSMMQVVLWFAAAGDAEVVMRFPFEIKGKPERDDSELARMTDSAKREMETHKKNRARAADFAARHRA